MLDFAASTKYWSGKLHRLALTLLGPCNFLGFMRVSVKP